MPLYTDQMDMETGVAHKGDAGLHVEFYEKKVIEPINVDAGRMAPEERLMVYCRIIIPGNKEFVWDQPVRPEDKQRFPRHWLAFNMSREDGGQVFGTPLKQWNTDDPLGFNENQLVELQSMRFQTVEQVARATDAQLQRMGLGAEGLKIRAQEYLSSKDRTSQGAELAATKKALEVLQQQMAELLNAKASGGLIEQVPTTYGQPPPSGVGIAAPASLHPEPSELTPAQARMAKARAARKVKTSGPNPSPVGAESHG